MKRLSGFTLIELMVAMSIVAVLLGLAIFAIQLLQVASRDSERKASLGNMNYAVQNYYRVKGRYPALGTNFNWVSDTSVDVGGTNVDLKGPTVKSPNNVTNIFGTYYTYGVNTDGYRLCALLENQTWYKLGPSAVACP